MKLTFQEQLEQFNQMYGLPVNPVPKNLGSQRLRDLKAILLAEVDEIDEIITVAEELENCAGSEGSGLEHVMLTAVADLMGDIQVYCGSEMVKWGLPVHATLDIIMASNMSKLGADGKPIINSQGKVEKGPNYWKPEPMLMKLITELTSGNLLPPDVISDHLLGQPIQR